MHTGTNVLTHVFSDHRHIEELCFMSFSVAVCRLLCHSLSVLGILLHVHMCVCLRHGAVT